MSRTPGKSPDDLSAPAPVDGVSETEDVSGPVSILEDADLDAPNRLADRNDPSPAEDAALLERESAAAADRGEGSRVDALICARALLSERMDDHAAALALWRSAFDRDPTLLVAFWGLRRGLVRQAAWEDLRGAVERRISALGTATRGHARADLWLEHGRLLEDRLGRDEDAAHSYRAGLLEAAEHAGLLTALLLLGFRRADPTTTAEALAGLLRLALPAALRASMSAFLARIERGGAISAPAVGAADGEQAVGDEEDIDHAPVHPQAAARALETLRSALRKVGPEDAGPLVSELGMLARTVDDAAARVGILGELIAHLPPDADRAGDRDRLIADGVPLGASLAVAFLREQARLLRDHLGDPAAATAALRTALTRAPGHPLVLAELSDLIEAAAGDDRVAAARGLGALLAEVAPANRPLETEAARELAIRALTALAASGDWNEGLATLQRYGQLAPHREDLLALEIVLRAGAGDRSGLAAVFERAGDTLATEMGRDGAGGAGDHTAAAEAVAHALVVAGTLREWDESGAAQPAGGEVRAASSSPLALFGRAVEVAPDYAPARQAVERRLFAAARWADLAAFWRQRLDEYAADRGSARPADGPVAAGRPDSQTVEFRRILDELVALHRDRLDDPGGARPYQDALIDASGVAGAGGAREWVRRYDLELAIAARGAPGRPADRVRILCALAVHADASGPACAGVAAALRVEAARIAAADDNASGAVELLRMALPVDASGAATAGLERLLDASPAGGPTASQARADLVRDELARLSGLDLPAVDMAARARALRFRIAWHARAAGRVDESLEVLRPLRAAGDAGARVWSWELARRQSDGRLQLDLLQATPFPPDGELLELPTDLGEACERSGDLPAAAAGFREALLRQPSMDAALGLLRVSSASGNAAVVLEAARHLAAQADPVTAPLLTQEVELLELLQGRARVNLGPAAAAAADQADHSGETGAEPMRVVLRWVAGTRQADALGAAAGLLSFARALPDRSSGAEAANDRGGLLARAAARSRLGGVVLAGAVHDQVAALSAGAAPIGVGMADLPVAGRPERLAARVARAERNGGALAYALDIERAMDAEARGEAAEALDGYGRALSRDPAGIEALDGIKRLALATGDRTGAARAGARLGAVLRSPGRAAAELATAAQIWEDLDQPGQAALAYWQALARDPASDWVYERLRQVLGASRDQAGLDRLYGHRLATLSDPRARAALLLERAQHRLEILDDRRAAIEDFKRILKIDPDHPHALRHLATLAVQMEYFASAIRFLERLLAREADEIAAAALRLELAEAYEAARDPARAIEVLRSAASTRPRDAAPWQRLTDLLLRTGDWSGALATLRSWDAVLAAPDAKAAIWVRIGSLQRDHGRDLKAAAAAFVTASELDPLGDGIGALVALQGRGETAGTLAATQRGALQRAIARLRGALTADPLDVPRLRRLKELCEWSAQRPESVGTPAAADAAGGALVAGQLLALAGEDVDLFPARRRDLRGILPVGFWSRLRIAGPRGLAVALWPSLAAATAQLFPPARQKPGPRERERIAHGSEPRLVWVEAAAVGAGVPTLQIWMPKKGMGDAADEAVVPLEGDEPGLFLGRGVLTGNAAVRFRVGRALTLLRDGAVALERISAAEIEILMAAAAVVAGAAPPVAPGAVKGIEERARTLGRAMSRKERHALQLEATRFGSEPLNAAIFRETALTTADRFGLVLAGDIAVAARVICERDLDGAPPLTAAELVGNPRALRLVQFALAEEYVSLRRESATGEG